MNKREGDKGKKRGSRQQTWRETMQVSVDENVLSCAGLQSFYVYVSEEM